ncbi:PQQ-dependent sugar dehydrogenase [Steroidobacter sp.]|uniref:PQQ-dependent sugar dehydrogenase n=1 Tax=Steroidobacter sp. TaxID=1978227 RepID=UPI001A4774F0|nr:PQQ-dependent sugar dehydrogenase [Steroidobacter sp.]MBL8267064.1 PQQ-dependent sugar dehydrogenase [Steroidobacter sp.]
MGISKSFGALVRVACLAVLFFTSPSHAATLPSGFSETRIATGLTQPTSLAVAPDGRVFVTQQAGQLRVIRNGVLLSQPFVTLTVNTLGERGLLGVALDPNFSTNRYVYLYYTSPTAPPRVNRVVRYTASASNPDVAESGSAFQLIELSGLSTAYIHNGGALAFGTDGKLYIATGDNSDSANAQSLETTHGKLLRINADGSIPEDNPFLGQTTGVNQAIWARGLRNPYTFAVDPGNGRIHVNDVGQDAWEEVNQGVAGANYGWPQTEGFTPGGVTGVRYPVHAYANAGTSCAIVGASFYRPTAPTFPSEYAGRYFFGDYCGGFIRTLSAPSYNTSADFATGIAALVDIETANDGSLYYLARGNGGELYRVQHTANAAPTINEHPVSVSVSAGQPATFTTSASGVQPLSYQWQRNGVAISGATQNSYTIASTTAADNGARISVVVTNEYGSATSNAATLTVVSNSVPDATIATPTAGTLYRGGQVFTFSGSATDPEDGALAASAFTWRVDFHHDDHTHPHLPATSGVTSGSFTIADRGETSANVFYRLILTVRDSSGLTDTTYVDIRPRTSVIRLTSNITSAQLTLDGVPVTAPYTFTGVEGIIRTLGVVSPQTTGGATYQFSTWSDGGARSHEIVTPTNDTTYTATLSASGSQSTLFQDDFESPRGWILTPGANTATVGLWQRGDPQPTSQNGVVLQPANCYSGTNCMITGLAAGLHAGVYDIDNGLTSMQSPAIALPAGRRVTLTFRYFLSHINTATSADYFRVRAVGANGVPVTIYQIPATSANVGAVWRQPTVDLSRFAGQTITLRFEAADSTSNGGTWIEAGFDDVVVKTN